MHAEETAQALPSPPKNARRPRRIWRLGCLGILLLSCVLLSTAVAALQNGPLHLTLPGGTTIKIGADNMVLSNYSFQNGTTYYFDMDGNGARNILQLDYLKDSNSVELVLHFADRRQEGEHHLMSLKLP